MVWLFLTGADEVAPPHQSLPCLHARFLCCCPLCFWKLAHPAVGRSRSCSLWPRAFLQSASSASRAALLTAMYSTVHFWVVSKQYSDIQRSVQYWLCKFNCCGRYYSLKARWVVLCSCLHPQVACTSSSTQRLLFPMDCGELAHPWHMGWRPHSLALRAESGSSQLSIVLLLYSLLQRYPALGTV